VVVTGTGSDGFASGGYLASGRVGSSSSAGSEECRKPSNSSARRRPSTATGVFVDAEAVKAKLRQSMATPQYDVGDFYYKEGFCQIVARSSWFEKTTLAVIGFNAVWIAVDTDMNKAAMLIDAHPIFQFAENGFCMYFTWEWVMRFCSFRRKKDGLKDAWFVFDSFMVFMMVMETWVMGVVILAIGSGFSGGNTGMLRLLRLLRLSRMARMAKLLHAFPELLILIKGMASATRSVFVTLLLLFMLIYLFSIAFRQLTDGSAVGSRYFPDMWVSMHTLWIDGTLLDGPGNVVSMLLDESLVFVLIFYVFVLLAALTVMNMLIGVLCEVVSAVAATERETIMMTTVKEGFDRIIREGGLDTDGDHMISRTEFVAILDNPSAVKLLDKVDVDVYAFVDLADFLFDEEDDESGGMSFATFMETVLSLRGSNTATVKDVVDLRKYIKTQFGSMENRIRRMTEAQLAGATKQLSSIPLSRVSVPDPPAAGKEMFAVVPPSGLSGGGADRTPSNVSVPRPPSSQLWMEAAEMQGVLDATRKKLQRFLSSLPPPPLPPCDAPIREDANRVGASTVGCPPTIVVAKDMRSDSTTASTQPSAAITTKEWSNGPLPGMVRGMMSLSSSEAPMSRPSSNEVVALALDNQNTLSLPLRLGELRARLQQLEHSMEDGAEAVHAIQELL